MRPGAPDVFGPWALGVVGMNFNLSANIMGYLIRDALAEDGISQAEFARRVGVSAKHLNAVVNGKGVARSGQLDYWAFILGREWHISLEHRKERQ